MPDTRRHRGPHPEDAALFAPAAWPALQAACADLAWLLDRGYAMPSALALVGNRFDLTQRQRLAVARSVCSAAQRDRRAEHQLDPAALAGADVWIDGYNLLITIESALGGGVILQGRDGCHRDLASLHGTYRTVAETRSAARLIGAAFADRGVATCRWVLDRPVSNSGRLRDLLLEIAGAAAWRWAVQLEQSPDALLGTVEGIVVSSDSVVLDRCRCWYNAAREILTHHVDGMNLVPMDSGPEAVPHYAAVR